VLVVSWAVLATLGMRNAYALAAVGSAIAVGYVTLREYALGARGVRRATGRSWPAAFLELFDRDQRRYGGYLVHIGLAVMAIAVVGSNIYQHQVRASVAPGQSFGVGGYTLTYERLFAAHPSVNGIDTEVRADITVKRGERTVATVEPGRRTFTNFPAQPVAIVAINGGFREDLYVFMQGWDKDLKAEFQVFVNPLVRWLWIGGAVYVLGAVLALSPGRASVRARVEVPAAATEPA
jgi:cytochrome c-type biogenesis protein CcmF